MSRTYGTVYYEERRNLWAVRCEPQVRIWLRRVFPRTAVEGEAVVVSATMDTTADLDWASQRYPLAVSDGARETWMALLGSYRARQDALAEIRQPTYVPPAFAELAVPPRDYQRGGADQWLRVKRILVADDLGLGKQQPIDARVLTPAGYVAIGSLTVGDRVIGSNGKPTRVIGVYPQGVKPSYRVTMGDGTSVEAGPEHLWSVDFRCGGRRWERVTVTTDQLRLGVVARRHGKTLDLRRTPLYLPMLSSPVEYDCPGNLPLPAYLVGQLLSNGACTHGVALVSNALDWPDVRTRLDVLGVDVGAVKSYGGATRALIRGIIGTLRALGMDRRSVDKRIPTLYMRASVEDRIALLQGLMDGDGSCSKTRSRVTYHSTSHALAADVVDLVVHLGGVATLRTYDRTGEGKSIEYQVRVRPPLGLNPFSVTRKASRYAPVQRAAPTRRIRSVEYVRDVESVCIAVDAPDSLYATEHAILTHNTCTALAAISDPRLRPALVVTMNHLQRQWRREVERFLPWARVHIVRVGRPAYNLDDVDDTNLMPDLVVMNYHKLAGWEPALVGAFKSVVFDECQELRRPSSDKYRAAMNVAATCEYRAGLSATPVYNYGGEIHSVLEVIAPDTLGTYQEFAGVWCDRGAVVQVGKTKKADPVKDPAALGAHLRDCGTMVRRTRSEVGRELPRFQRVVQHVDADLERIAEAEKRVEELCRLLVSGRDLSQQDRFGAEREIDMRMRQATGVAKAPYVADFVQMLVEGGEEKVLVGGWHHAFYDVVMDRLAELNPVKYTGDETLSQKERARHAFIHDPDCHVMVISNRAGAGLDGLQGVCRTVVHAELDWSPRVHEQIDGRVHRDGQAEPVMSYFLLSEVGSDPAVAQVLGVKEVQSLGIVGRAPDVFDANAAQASREQVMRLAEAVLARRARP